MHDQGRHVDLLQVLREVRLGEGLDAVDDPFEARLHPLHPERIAQPLRHLRAGTIGAVERPAQILEELRAVRQNAGADPIEHFHWQAPGVCGCLQHDRRHGANQHRLGDALRAVAADVAGDFSAAGGVTHVDCVAQIERLGERREIVGVGIHLIAVPWLAGSTVTAAVVRDTAVAVEAQKHHLVFPGVRAQRPAVAEDHGSSTAPVLVVEPRAVLGRDRAHRIASSR